MPPHLDSEGDEVAACVSLRPFGKYSRDALINMSVDEAEELARQLVAVVTDARKGRFCEHGVQMAEDMREQGFEGGMVSPGNRGSGRWRVAICVGAVNGFGPPAWGFGDGQDWAVSRSAGVAGDPHGRWSLERRAVSVQRRGITWEDA